MFKEGRTTAALLPRMRLSRSRDAGPAWYNAPNGIRPQQIAVSGVDMSEDMERIYREITVRRAEVLSRLADNYSERDIAKQLGIEISSVRSHVEHLRAITGQAGVREVGRWWRANRAAWVREMARTAGVEAVLVETQPREPS
jgi:FixJ family two-component response regulator